MINIETKIYPRQNSNLLASVSILIIGDGFTIKINDMAIVQTKDNQKKFISFPSRQYKDIEGETKYSKIIELSNTLKIRIENKVLKDYEKNIIDNGYGKSSQQEPNSTLEDKDLVYPSLKQDRKIIGYFSNEDINNIKGKIEKMPWEKIED